MQEEEKGSERFKEEETDPLPCGREIQPERTNSCVAVVVNTVPGPNPQASTHSNIRWIPVANPSLSPTLCPPPFHRSPHNSILSKQSHATDGKVASEQAGTVDVAVATPLDNSRCWTAASTFTEGGRTVFDGGE